MRLSDEPLQVTAKGVLKGQIQIGKYQLVTMENGNIWISHENGEGGEFTASAIEYDLSGFMRDYF